MSSTHPTRPIPASSDQWAILKARTRDVNKIQIPVARSEHKRIAQQHGKAWYS